MTRMEKIKNPILEGVIWKQLLFFFFPILWGSLFQQLYNTADTVIVGQYIGTGALAAVGATGTVIQLIVGFFIGISSGTTVIISQHYGAFNKDGVSKAVHTSIAMAIAAGLFLMVFGLFSAPAVLHALHVPEDILGDALMYINVYYCGMVGNMLYNVGTGILRSIGDSKRPLVILIIASLTNIALDFLFVAVFHFGIFGAALATILSQFLSAALVIAILLRAQDSYRLTIKQIRFHFRTLKQIFRIGLPAGMQSVMYGFSTLLAQRSINHFGTTCIAAWSAVSKIDGIIWMVMAALGISVTTFVGQNFGAKNYSRVKKCSRSAFLMGISSILLLSAAIFCFRYPLLRFFTNDEAVVTIGADFFIFLAPFYFIFLFTEICSGIIRGCGESLQPMLLTCFGICAFRILWLTFIVPLHEMTYMVALCYPISWTITAACFLIYYKRNRWMTRCIWREHNPAYEK